MNYMEILRDLLALSSCEHAQLTPCEVGSIPGSNRERDLEEWRGKVLCERGKI